MLTEQTLRMPCYMVDNRFRMRAAAFMNLAQQIGEDNAEAGDFGFQRLKDQGLAWVLSRQFVTFHQLPKFKETVKLQTWHRGVEGPFYIRDYRMYAQDGTLLVESSSSWVVLNLESRAMILPQSLGLQNDADESAGKLGDSSESAAKLVAPRTVEARLAGVRDALYSDIDYNTHVNNVRYIEWAMDVLPFEYTDTHTIKRLDINFNHEIHPGEKAELWIREPGDGVFFIDGRIDGRQSFIIRFEFE